MNLSWVGVRGMHIEDLLAASDVVVDFAARDKADLPRVLAVRAASVLKLSSDAVVDTIQSRDELGSTGIGTACRFRMRDCANKKALRLEQPLDYQAIDSEPVDIVSCCCYPPFSQLKQLNALAVITGKLRDKGVLERVRSATDAVELYRAIRHSAARRRANQPRQLQMAAAA